MRSQCTFTTFGVLRALPVRRRTEGQRDVPTDAGEDFPSLRTRARTGRRDFMEVGDDLVNATIATVDLYRGRSRYPGAVITGIWLFEDGGRDHSLYVVILDGAAAPWRNRYGRPSGANWKARKAS